MKIAVSSYAYNRFLTQGLHSHFSIIPLTASLGFDGIEFTDLQVPEGFTEESYAVMLREEAARCGIAIVNYAVSANLLMPGEAERLKNKVDVAALLGSPLLRFDCYFDFPAGTPEGTTFWDVVDKAADAAREVAQYAETKGIRTCTENHGFECQDADRMKMLMEKVNHPNYGWLVDIGNFLCTDGDPLPSVKTALPFLFHAHVKDFTRESSPDGCIATPGGSYIRGTVLGRGIVPVKDCVNAIRSTGYTGYYTLEFEGPEDIIPALQEGLTYLKSI